jgi:hypothetical protein
LRHERHAVLQRNREEQVHVIGRYELNHRCTGVRESGIGWLPYALDRMDFEYEGRFRDLMKLKPSEYWRRQCKATFQFDPIGHQARRRHRRRDPDVGLRLPAHRRRMAGILEIHRGAIRRPRAEIVHKITCEDAAKFYGLIN